MTDDVEFWNRLRHLYFGNNYSHHYYKLCQNLTY